MPNLAIAIHDSTLASLTIQSGHVILGFSEAHTYQSEGRPGTDAGTCGIQHAVIHIRGEIASGSLTKLPCTLTDGYIALDDKESDNLIPIPLSFTGDVELAFTSEFAETIKIRGNHIALGLLHEPRYVEEFPGTAKP